MNTEVSKESLSNYISSDGVSASSWSWLKIDVYKIKLCMLKTVLKNKYKHPLDIIYCVTQHSLKRLNEQRII